MNESNTEVLIKSEKKSQKMKIRFVWAIAALLIIVTMVFSIIDYIGYKKGQEYGLLLATASTGSSWINTNDSYAEQCKDVYDNLNRRTYGSSSISSSINKNEDAIRTVFADYMNSAGYDRYRSYNIADWFKYTDFADYFLGYYWYTILPICCYIVLIFSITFSILFNRETKKELVIYNDSVLCRVNPKRSIQLVFDDITNINFGKTSLKIVGKNIKFKILNITNVDNIKAIIIEKKKSEQSKSIDSNIGNANEIKKYKELFDSGVISQEEFVAKKKQLLKL